MVITVLDGSDKTEFRGRKYFSLSGCIGEGKLGVWANGGIALLIHGESSILTLHMA